MSSLERRNNSEQNFRIPDTRTELPDGLHYSEGLTEKQIDQLVQFSNNPEDVATQNNTSDPKRFKDKDAVEKWLRKGRSVYTISSPEGDLLGISWLGAKNLLQEEQNQNNERTFIQDFDPSTHGVSFAIRLYEGARGKKLSDKFTAHAIAQYRKTAEYQGLVEQGQNGIWLEVSAANAPAVNSYKKTGFTQVTDPDNKSKMLMILNTKVR